MQSLAQRNQSPLQLLEAAGELIDTAVRSATPREIAEALERLRTLGNEDMLNLIISRAGQTFTNAARDYRLTWKEKFELIRMARSANLNTEAGLIVTLFAMEAEENLLVFGSALMKEVEDGGNTHIAMEILACIGD